MSSKAITERPESTPSWPAVQELAPSELKPDEPTVARWVGLGGWFFLAMGLVILFLLGFLRRSVDIGPFSFGGGGAIFLCYLSLMAILYHAAVDRDVQVRRSYGLVGYILLAVAIVVLLIPIEGTFGYLFMPWSMLSFIVALLFLLPFVRCESEPARREWTINVPASWGRCWRWRGSSAVAIAATSSCRTGWCALCWAWPTCGPSSSAATARTRWHTGSAWAWQCWGSWPSVLRWVAGSFPGSVTFFGYTAAPTDGYFGDTGLLVVLTGLLYLGTALGLCSDNRFVVLTRRELAGFFYSPIAFLVLFGFFMIATSLHWWFVHRRSHHGEQWPGHPGAGHHALHVEYPGGVLSDVRRAAIDHAAVQRGETQRHL